jgi:large subunit ribosomal protein L28
MSRVCEVTGKKGLNGNRVSHANNKSHHVQKPNLRKKRVFVAELGRFVKVRLSVKGLRVLDKKGPYRALKEAGLL